MHNNHLPEFLMWQTVDKSKAKGWERYWFSHGLNPKLNFNIRGLGLFEPMVNTNVDRPYGTGDWLIMFFHRSAKLNKAKPEQCSAPNTLIIWPPGAPQFFSWAKQQHTEPHSWIHCEGDWIADKISQNQLACKQEIVIEDSQIITQGLGLLRDELLHPACDKTILMNLFENWLRQISRSLQPTPVESSPPAYLIELHEYLETHFTQAIHLQQLAKQANLSESHLCNQFKRYFECSIYHFVLKKRIALAQRLLFDMNLRISEIATLVGYNDVYQFSKQFKKQNGVSPRQYRQQL